MRGRLDANEPEGRGQRRELGSVTHTPELLGVACPQIFRAELGLHHTIDSPFPLLLSSKLRQMRVELPPGLFVLSLGHRPQ